MELRQGARFCYTVAAFMAVTVGLSLFAQSTGPKLSNHRYSPTGSSLFRQKNLRETRTSPLMTVVDKGCPRYIYVNPETNTGLGDRFLRYALLATLALDRQLTPVYEPGGLLSEATDGAHGSYPWAQAFLNWGEGMLRLSDINRREKFKMERISFQVALEDYTDTLVWTPGAKPKCHVMYELYEPPINFIGAILQTRNQPRLYERIEARAQASFLSVPPSMLPSLAFENVRHDYNVVIHIRTGDIIYPGDPAFLEQVKANLDILLQDEPVHYYFIAEDPEAGDDRPPRGFEYLSKVFKGARVKFLNKLDVRASLYHMMNADLLVMTGSGFPIIAAVTSWKPVVLRGPNKTGDYELFEHIDWIRLDAKGVIYEPPALSEVYAKIMVKKHLFHGRTVP